MVAGGSASLVTRTLPPNPAKSQRAIIEKEAIVFDRLEEAALRLVGYAAESAGRVRNNVNVFRIGLKTSGPN